MAKTTEASQAHPEAAQPADTATVRADLGQVRENRAPADTAAVEIDATIEEAADTGQPAEGDDSHDGQGKGNKEAAKYRRQLREVEAERDTLAAQHDALRKQVVEARSGLQRPEALWAAGVELAGLFDADGRLDADKLDEAVGAATDRFGLRAVAGTPRFDPTQGSRGDHQPATPSLADAFTPR